MNNNGDNGNRPFSPGSKKQLTQKKQNINKENKERNKQKRFSAAVRDV